MINPYSIPPLICAILIFFTGSFVLSRNPKQRLNQVFFLLCGTATLWLSFYGISFSIPESNIEFIKIMYRIDYCGVNFIAIVYFHYVLTFLQLKHFKWWNIFNYVYGFFICVLIWGTDLIINKSLQHHFWGFYPLAGHLHPLFLTYFIFLLLFSLFLLIQTLKRSDISPTFKNQIKYVTFALGIWALACVDFIPNYGIELYPFGYIPTTIFMLIIAYAAARYKLMDINIVIKKSIVYSLLIAVITFIYFIAIFISEKIFQDVIGYRNLFTSIFTAIIIAAIFYPIKERLQKFADRTFFKGTPLEIAAQNEFLLQEVADKEKFKSVAILASGMAHEIKNPLTAIKIFSEYLPLKMNDPEFLLKFSRIVGKEADRINALVHQLLEFSRPSDPKLQETSIQSLIDEVLEFLSSQFVNYNIKVEKNFESNGAIILKIDPNQFRQVFLNLFINAVEAMPKGGTLTVETSVGNGHARSLQSNHIQITIADTGAGIPPEILKSLFAPFHTTKAKGTGLGLTITKSIIESHKGKIRVESELGKGTRFIVELPTMPHQTP